MTPSVHTVILTWNSREDALACLQSLAASNYPNLHTILVDNASGDGTVEEVRRHFAVVEAIENSRNLGFAEGNNVGMRRALNGGAEYVLLLNPDVTVEPDAIARLVESGESSPKIGMLCPRIISVADPLKQYLGATLDVSRVFAEETLAGEQQEPQDTDYAPGCAVLIKSSVVDRIGLLDPAFFAYFEDTDWSYRARRAGYRIVAVPEACVHHKGTVDQATQKAPLAHYLYRRNQWLFMHKHWPWYRQPSFLRYYTRDALLQIEAVIRSGQSVAVADAIIDGWYAALTGRYGERIATAPAALHRFTLAHLDLLLRWSRPIEALRARFPVRTAIRRLAGGRRGQVKT